MTIPLAVIEDLAQRQIDVLSFKPIRIADHSTIRNDTFRITDQNNTHYFLKIGRWMSQPDDRSLWHEVEALGRLIQHYPDDINLYYSGLVTASELDIEQEESVLTAPSKRRRSAPKQGYLLLNYKKGLDTWRLPGKDDQALVEKAILYLQEAGVIHLDITTNLLVRGTTEFFWMDFEAMVLHEPGQASYQRVYHLPIKEIAKKVCLQVKIPTPSLPSRHQSRMENLFEDTLDSSPDDDDSISSSNDSSRLIKRLF